MGMTKYGYVKDIDNNFIKTFIGRNKKYSEASIDLYYIDGNKTSLLSRCEHKNIYITNNEYGSVVMYLNDMWKTSVGVFDINSITDCYYKISCEEFNENIRFNFKIYNITYIITVYL